MLAHLSACRSVLGSVGVSGSLWAVLLDPRSARVSASGLDILWVRASALVSAAPLAQVSGVVMAQASALASAWASERVWECAWAKVRAHAWARRSAWE